MDKTLLTVLACPNCKGKLSHSAQHDTLSCPVCQLSYPIEDNIPVMLIERATALHDENDE